MKTVYALGVFDGVHLGHQALLKACAELAKQENCAAGAVTFDTHPDGLISGKAPTLLCTVEDRKKLIESYGIDQVLILPFDENLRTQPWQDFLHMLVKKGAAGVPAASFFV